MYNWAVGEMTTTTMQDWVVNDVSTTSQILPAPSMYPHQSTASQNIFRKTAHHGNWSVGEMTIQDWAVNDMVSNTIQILPAQSIYQHPPTAGRDAFKNDAPYSNWAVGEKTASMEDWVSKDVSNTTHNLPAPPKYHNPPTAGRDAFKNAAPYSNWAVGEKTASMEDWIISDLTTTTQDWGSNEVTTTKIQNLLAPPMYHHPPIACQDAFNKAPPHCNWTVEEMPVTMQNWVVGDFARPTQQDWTTNGVTTSVQNLTAPPPPMPSTLGQNIFYKPAPHRDWAGNEPLKTITCIPPTQMYLLDDVRRERESHSKSTRNNLVGKYRRMERHLKGFSCVICGVQCPQESRALHKCKQIHPDGCCIWCGQRIWVTCNLPLWFRAKHLIPCAQRLLDYAKYSMHFR